MDGPRVECKSEKDVNGDKFNHRTEGLMEVYTRVLVESFSNEASLIPRDGAIKIMFGTTCNQ